MHFLSAADFSKQQYEGVFGIADTINSGTHLSLGRLSTLAILFEGSNPRERISLENAAALLGSKSVYVDACGSGGDPAAALARAEKQFGVSADVVAAVTLRHSDLVDFARSSKVPVINVLTDLERPVQALNDAYTIAGFKGGLGRLRIACIGNGAKNSVSSFMLAATRLGADIVLVGPGSEVPGSKYLKAARRYGSVEICDDMAEGLAEADVVYVAAQGPGGARQGKQPNEFSRYQINGKTLRYAGKDAIIVHPMPAFRGVEITADVIDGPRSVVWMETKNKVRVEQALIKYVVDGA
jgi:ornithine carbamoyltransferase